MATRMRYGPRFRSSAVSVGNRINVYVPPTVKFQTEEQRMFGSAKRHGTMSKVAMPKFSFSGRPVPSTRDIAEKRLIERLAEAIRLIEYGLAELAEAPPPPKIQYQSCVNQKLIVHLLGKLRWCVTPPLADHAAIKPQRVTMKLDDMPLCCGCGGPGRIEWRQEWWCEDCLPPSAPYKTSVQRREHERDVREMEREANKFRDAINSVQEAMKNVEGHRRHSRQDAKDLGISRTEENLRDGGEDAYLPGESDSGDPEG